MSDHSNLNSNELPQGSSTMHSSTSKSEVPTDSCGETASTRLSEIQSGEDASIDSPTSVLHGSHSAIELQPTAGTTSFMQPRSPDDGYVQVDPLFVKVETTATMIFFSLVAIGILVAHIVWLSIALIAGGTWILPMGALVLSELSILGIAWICYKYEHWAHACRLWRLTETGLEIKKGVWWRHTVFVPRSRVQHTDITQGPLLRRYDLANLVIHTAGTHEPEITLAGLRYSAALRLRTELIRSRFASPETAQEPSKGNS